MERRFAVHAGSYRQTLIAAVVLAAASANASPRTVDAKRSFDRGVAAYAGKDYAVAAAAFAESFAREDDPETLFAWAQAERKSGHCDNALPLYEKLLGYELPAENRSVITTQRAECIQIVAARPTEEKPAAQHAEPPVAQPAEPPIDRPAVPSSAREDRAWWRDPVGDTLVGVGAVGVGVGVALLVSAHSADQAKSRATSYRDYKDLADRARVRGDVGIIAGAAGAVLVVGGIVWYATHRSHDRGAVTGWLAPGTGGVAVSYGF